MKNKVFLFVFLFFALLVSAYAIYVYIESKNDNTVLTPVSVRLKWLHQAQFAGNYVAEQKNYYKEEGLDVELKAYDYKNDPIEEVVSGKSDFGITGAENIIVARNQGKKVKALAVVYQDSPAVAFSLKSSGILELKDFVGKRLGVSKDLEAVIMTMLKSSGIGSAEVKIMRTDFGIDPLIKNEVDVGTGYVTNEVIQLEENGQEVEVFAPYKFGVKMYADVLFTTEEMIAKNPGIVAGFVKATLRGWEYALSHVDEAVKLTLLYKDDNNKALNYDHQKALLDKSVPFIKPNINRKVGEMNYVDWKRTNQLLVDSGVVQNKLEVSHMYTTEFISP
ncbi:MAG TPA: ABC transporter substrate-binding protein [Candidatus Methanoperedens sp.]|nr:ABC transporter substrate-binding protein [Candidatus Methanoperedens sp.]